MDFLDNYRKRMVVNDEVVRDRTVKLARERIRKRFMAIPSAFTVSVLEPDGSLQVPKRIRVINEGVLRQLNPERVYSKYAVTHPDDKIRSGSIIFDLYQEEWLVGAVTGLGDVHDQLVLQKLNETISFKDSQGIVQAIPAVVNGVSRVSDGIEVMNAMIMPDELVKIRVQEDAITRGIRRDLRIKIANKMYKVSKIDTYTDVDVINIIAREDLIEPGDAELEKDQEDPVIVPTEISGMDKITRTRNYTYVSPYPNTIGWELEGDQNIVKKTEGEDKSTVTLRAEKTQLITFKLFAVYQENGEKKRSKPKEIRIVSLM